MNLSTHFTLDMLTVSQWARRNNVSNTPNESQIENLKRLAAMLEVVQYKLGCPLTISSAFRSPEVNRNIGGSSTSVHLHGLAADFTAPRFGAPADICRKIMGEELIKFDQLIHEYGAWVHIGLPYPGKQPRFQLLSVFRPGRYLAGILDKEPVR